MHSNLINASSICGGKYSATLNKSQHNKLMLYGITGLVFIVPYWFLRDSNWQGSITLYRGMKLCAARLAIIVGLVALKLYRTSNANVLILVVGAGFIGTGLLGGYHTAITPVWVKNLLPSKLDLLIPWNSRFHEQNQCRTRVYEGRKHDRTISYSGYITGVNL